MTLFRFLDNTVQQSTVKHSGSVRCSFKIIHNYWLSFCLSCRTSPELTGSCGTGACVSSASLKRRTRHAVRVARIHRNLRSSHGAPYRPTTAAAGLQCDGFLKPQLSSVRPGWTQHSHSGTFYCNRLIPETLG